MSVRSELRASALERAGYQCEWPGSWHERRLELAHLVQRSQGGDDTAVNTVILCGHHHDVLDNRASLKGRRTSIMELLDAYLRVDRMET